MAGEQAIHNSQWSPCCAWRLAVFPPLSSAWSLCVFVPPCADACAVFRGCALRFARVSYSSPSGLRVFASSLAALPASLGSSALLQSLAARSFALIGGTTACFAHCARRSSVSLGLRPVSATGGYSCAPRISSATAYAPPPFKKKGGITGFWAVLLPWYSISKRLPWFRRYRR